VADMNHFVVLGVDFKRNYQIHPHCVGMVLGNRVQPLFLLKYFRVAEMVSIERLGWILNVFFHPHCVGTVWGNRFRPLFLFKYRRVAKMINIDPLGWILNVFSKSTHIKWVWCGVEESVSIRFCKNVAGWLK